jgi:hypothetical protein
MLEWLEWLEGTGFAAIARESLYGFQILVAIHLLGLIFSVGTLLWVDLRMLGVDWSGQPVAVVYRSLSRWFLAGFAIMLLSGSALFAGFATSAYENTYFRIKLAVMLLAGLNAAAFHVLLNARPAAGGSGAPAGAVRLAGALSILSWSVVILCGRLMSYTLF